MKQEWIKRIINTAVVLLVTGAAIGVALKYPGQQHRVTAVFAEEDQQVALSHAPGEEDRADVSGNGQTDVTGNEQANVPGNNQADVTGNEQAALSGKEQTGEAEAVDEAQIENTEEDEYANLAIANVDRYVNIRSIPSTDGEILGKLYDGAVAQIQEVAGEDQDWFKIVSGDVEGYIKAEYFIYGDAAADVMQDYVTRYARVEADRLNIRKEPDQSSKRIGYADYDEQLKLVEDCGDWLKVEYTEGQDGYVSAEYVTLTEEFTYAVSIEEEKRQQALQQELLAREKASEKAVPENTSMDQEMQAVAEQSVQAGATDSELRSSLVNLAMQYLGNVYVHGGQSLETGTDCSGFTCYLYAAFGYSISRTPSGQLSSAGRSIEYSQIQPGDIICYSSNGKSCTHVGLYIGDGQIIHAANSRKGVVISAADYSTIIGVKNVID